MRLKQKIIMSALAVTLAGGAIFGTTYAFAQSNTTESSTLVQMIADKFGLNKNDVQGVFDQFKTQRQTQMETKFEDRLTQDVTAGKITEAQKQLIIAKRKELQGNRQAFLESLKNMTAADRKAALDKQHQDLQNWATQNNIDIKYLMPGFGGRGMGMMHGKWMAQ